MGKGISKRRRMKRLERANDGNLHKAALGKRGATANLKLPEGPPKEKELVERMPASLRKMLVLKEAADKQEKQKAERKAGLLKKGPDAAQEDSRHASGQQAGTSGRDVHIGGQGKQRQQPHQGHAGKPGGGAQDNSKQHGSKGNAGAANGQGGDDGAPGSKQTGNPGKPEEKIYVSSAFEKPVKKGLKEKKKAYLNKRKEMKKKGKKKGGAADDGLTPAEIKLRAQQAVTAARFGEVADAPLQVHLKRKHWVQGEGGAAEGADSGSGERMKKIFLQQMATAQQRAAGTAGAGSGGQPAKKKQRSGDAAGSVGKQGQKQQEPIGLLQKAKLLADAAKKKAEAEAMREQVVAAYRAHKQGAMGSGGASMATLAKLVKRGADAAARASALS